MTSLGNCFLNTFSERNICVAEVTSPIRLPCPAGSNSANRAAFSLVLRDCVSMRILFAGTPIRTAIAFITSASLSVSFHEGPPQNASKPALLLRNVVTPLYQRE